MLKALIVENYDVFREFLYPDIKVIILTKYDLQEYREAAYQFGADYFLSKSSLTERTILDVVQSILHDLDHEKDGNI